MSLNRVKPGEQILPIEASTWNAFVDAAVAARAVNNAVPPGVAGFQAGLVPALNATGGDFSRFDVVGIDGSIFAGPTVGALNYGAIRLATTATFGKVAICAEPIRDDGIGKVWVTGLAVTDKLNITQTWHNRCDVISGVLTSHPAGSWQILEKQTGTGTGKRAVLRYEGAKEIILDSIAPSAWTPGTTKTCTIYRAGSPTTWTQSVTYDGWTSTENISSGKNIRIRWSLDFNPPKWVISEAECE